MILLYIWAALAVLLCVLFVLKLILQIGIMVLAACLKKVR